MNNFHLKSAGNQPLRALPPLAALQAFERAATHLSFRRAAQDLALTPSAVSHQIRTLEEKLGVRLFARGGRSVRLTPEGERYLRTASAALAALDEATRDLMRAGQGGASKLRVSALPFFTSAVLLPSLGEFRRRHPDIEIHILATHDYADMDAPGVDLAIRYGRERSSGLRLEPLLDVGSLPVCAPTLLPKLVKPADLAHHTLIHVAPQPRAWQAWFKDRKIEGFVPKGELWLDNVPAAIEAAERGLGVALAMHPLIESREGFGKTLAAPFNLPPQRTETLYLVSRPEQTDDRKIVAFRRWLAEAVARASAGKLKDRRPAPRPRRS